MRQSSRRRPRPAIMATVTVLSLCAALQAQAQDVADERFSPPCADDYTRRAATP